MNKLNLSKSPKVDITYLGGLWENLTGSSKLLTIKNGAKIYNLLIDAGSRQWWLDQDIFNATMPVDVSTINAIILTHAHMDHIGKIARYIRHWYNWPIYTTPITKSLVFEALKDEQKIFQRILEEKKEILTRIKKAFSSVKRHNSNNYEWWAKIKKLWEKKTADINTRQTNSINMLKRNSINTWEDIKVFENTVQTMDEERERSEQDIFEVMSLIKTMPYNKTIQVIPKVASATFYNAWHIEWSAQVDIGVGQKNLLFSGDLWRIRDNLVVWNPVIPKKNKYSFLSLESTYAGKRHPDRVDAENELFDEIANTHWPVLLPCFSLQRIPEVLLTLLKGKERLDESEESVYSDRASKKDTDWKKARNFDTIYVDSPLGKKYKEIFLKELWSKYKNINTKNIKFVSVTDREQLLLRIKKWHRILILSSSGMLQWWSVMHYLPEILQQRKWKIIFTWYSGKNTLAWQIVDGNKRVSIGWNNHEVMCDSKYITWFSSHADHDELVDYTKGIQKVKWAKIVLEHGWATREILAKDLESTSVKVLIPQEWDKIHVL
jgi:metallo-beta-lactamase family protein